MNRFMLKLLLCVYSVIIAILLFHISKIENEHVLQIELAQEKITQAESKAEKWKESSETYMAQLEVIQDKSLALEKVINEQKQEIAHWMEKAEIRQREVRIASATVSKFKVVATAYTPYCDGCRGITYSGVDVRENITHEGYPIIAVDPKIIPLGTKVRIFVNGEDYGIYTAEDIGSAIKGYRIDILMGTKKEALRFGRQHNVEVHVLDDSF